MVLPDPRLYDSVYGADRESASDARVRDGMSAITCGKTAASGSALAVVILAVAWLGSSGAPVTTTAGPTVKAEGVIVSVDPNVSSFTISGPQGTQEFDVTPDTVIGLGGAEHIAFDDLARFVGVESIVLSSDTGAEQDARSVTLLVMPARAVTPPGGSRERP